MKSFCISMLIIVLLLSFWLFMNDFLNVIVEDLDNKLSKLENYFIKENWKEAGILFGNIENNWRKSIDMLMLVIDRDEIEKINYSLSQIASYLKIEDKVSLIGEVDSLKYHINHIREMVSLTVNNIF